MTASITPIRNESIADALVELEWHFRGEWPWVMVQYHKCRNVSESPETSVSLQDITKNQQDINMETPTGTYESPETFIEPASAGNIICTSPQPGGNEDVDYEDWSL